MKIIFSSSLPNWNPTDERIGGTEESIVRWADELQNRGHQVIVFRQGESRSFNGVPYVSDERFISYEGGADISIAVNNYNAPIKGKTLYLTNETDADSIDLSKYDGVILPTQWAKESVRVNNDVYIVPHGYDSEKIKPGEKIDKRCIYTSSPDRGLESLQRIWPGVVDKHPDAELVVSYGGFIDTPNTRCGSFTEKEMDDLYNTADLWLHPCSGGEMYGMSAVKAQAAGAIPIYFPMMALNETVQHGYSCADEREMMNKIIELLDDKDRKEKDREVLASKEYVDWNASTTELENVILKV